MKTAEKIAKESGVTINTRVIGPRRDYEDHAGDWASAREIADSGCLLVRPDQHVAFRAMTVTPSAEKDLTAAFTKLLGH